MVGNKPSSPDQSPNFAFAPSSTATQDLISEPKDIVINITGSWRKNKKILVKMNVHQTFWNVVDEMNNIGESEVMTYNGVYIFGNDTPASLGMEDGDKVELCSDAGVWLLDARD